MRTRNEQFAAKLQTQPNTWVRYPEVSELCTENNVVNNIVDITEVKGALVDIVTVVHELGDHV